MAKPKAGSEQVFTDMRNGSLAPTYDYLRNFPDISLVGPARRSILRHEKYAYKGTRMVDLFHASRGCRFNCFPCCTPFLGGRNFRPRPIDKVVEELATIDNDRLFVVDNSLAQDKRWELDLFTAMAPFKKHWCCHPIEDDDEVLERPLRPVRGTCTRPYLTHRILSAKELRGTSGTASAWREP